MARLSMDLIQYLAQECGLCLQEIIPDHQLPLNAIVIFGYGVCPSCRQTVSTQKQRDQKYRRRHRQFRKGLQLDL
jgi:hypothetical protein